MTIHRIRLLGDPILRTRCEPITKPRSTAVRVILDDMRETLRDWQSRFGSGRAIAAPQIGAPVRMIYVEMDKPWPLINPEIIDIGTEDFTVWDDCFSFPNLMVQVSRAYRIRVHYQDIKGDDARGRAGRGPRGAAAARNRPSRRRAGGGPAARARSVLPAGGMEPPARRGGSLRRARAPARALRHAAHRADLTAR